ncbi:MAG: hypothetical protein V3U92_19640 [Cellulophaga sp.]
MPVFISLVLGIGMVTFLQIFIGILSGQLYQQTEADIDLIAQTVSNETVATGTNATGYLSTTLDSSPVVASSQTIYCGGTTLLSGNYTLAESGTLIIDSTAVYCNATIPVYAGYQYGNPTAEGYLKVAMSNNFKAQATASQYTNLIVIAGVVSLIIVLIFGAFASVGLGTGTGMGSYGGKGGYGRVL